MPRRCVVPNCTSNSSSKLSKATYVSTFLFPSEEQKQKLWLEHININCNSDLSDVTRSSGICIKHFEEKYIITDARVTRADGSVLSLPLNRPRLAAEAVPTIFSKEKDFIHKKVRRKVRKGTKR